MLIYIFAVSVVLFQVGNIDFEVIFRWFGVEVFLGVLFYRFVFFQIEHQLTLWLIIRTILCAVVQQN